jgi:hypothetical protein
VVGQPIYEPGVVKHFVVDPQGVSRVVRTPPTLLGAGRDHPNLASGLAAATPDWLRGWQGIPMGILGVARPPPILVGQPTTHGFIIIIIIIIIINNLIFFLFLKI